MNDTLNGIIAYLKSVKLEWAKITWPERKQVIAETVAVVAIVFLFTVSVYLIDIIFKAMLGLIPTRQVNRMVENEENFEQAEEQTTVEETVASEPVEKKSSKKNEKRW